jgi:hypothetical protein
VDFDVMSSLGMPAPVLERAVNSVRVMPVHEMLYGLCDAMGVQFLMAGEPVGHAGVLSPSALLPAIAWMSQDAGVRLLQADFGCLLRKPAAEEVTLLGCRCIVPPVTGHIADITRALFFAHFTFELLGLRQGAMVEVFPLHEMLQPVFLAHMGSVNEGNVSWPQMSPTI